MCPVISRLFVSPVVCVRLGQHSPFSFRITLFLRQVSVRVCVGFPEAKRRMRGGNVHPGPSSSFVCRKPRGYIRNHKRRRLGNHIHRRRVCNSRANRFQPFFSGSFRVHVFFSFFLFFLIPIEMTHRYTF